MNMHHLHKITTIIEYLNIETNYVSIKDSRGGIISFSTDNAGLSALAGCTDLIITTSVASPHQRDYPHRVQVSCA